MTCDQFRERIPELLSGTAPMPADASIHLADCGACGAEYAAYCRTVSALKAYRPAAPSPSMARALRNVQAAAPPRKTFRLFGRRAEGASHRARRGLFRPGSWHWSAQFTTALVLGSLAGVWLVQSWKPSVADLGALPRLEAGLNPLPRNWNGGMYDQGTGPVTKIAPLRNDVDRTLWRADLGYVRLEDQLNAIFKDLKGVRYYLHPSLRETRISPLVIKEATPFPLFLQRLAHASNLTVQVDRAGKPSLMRRDKGALMYRRGPIYYFVPKGEGISPLATDLARALRSEK